ncbi:MAG: bifunctional phosphopantothenoylcysteine decarboxylase/phosphopantothenate--cysteine ligase CoaBC [Candidatus Thalassarchaeaceae archaeon]|nr:bifunctional phosphopantothenoylcysteine decarboxylase/phosphopantothenate--cysteine ligase CoaBC [Candidatus Thalassarchaeaceae archaeon]
MGGDTGVASHSRTLQDKHILLAVSGGIAATESVKISRELRRHGAHVSAMMTRSAQKVISPLAVSWGSGSDVLTEWKPEMSQLGQFDGVLVAPATRNSIAKHVNGITDSPVMMALAAASGNGTPILFVPSMHEDLFDSQVTIDLIGDLEKLGHGVLLSDSEEGKRKQPDPVSLVAHFSNFINRAMNGRKRVVVTLGSNREPIDSVRAVHNTSSGRTGWAIAEHLHRMGHQVTCIVGHTSSQPSFQLPDVRVDHSSEGMLEISLELAGSSDGPHAWVHSAAILDYIPESSVGKRPSGKGKWEISLHPGPKHLERLASSVNGSTQIGFKLEVGTDYEELEKSAQKLLEKYELDAVIANLLREARGNSPIRCRLITPDGKSTDIKTQIEMCESIECLISTIVPNSNE